MGNFNERIENSVTERGKQRYNEDMMNRNAKLLIQLCSYNQQRINNTNFHHKLQHNRPTIDWSFR